MGRRPILQAVAVFVWAASVLAQDGTLSAQIANTAPDVRDLLGVLVSRHLLEAEALAVGDIVRLSADDTGDRARPFRVVFGVVLAVVSQDGFNRFFQWRYDTPLVFVCITPLVIWRSVAYAVPLGLAAAVASAWLSLRRDVLTLFRR